MSNFALSVFFFILNYFSVLKILSSKSCEGFLFGFHPITVILWACQTLYLLLNRVLNNHKGVPLVLIEMVITKILLKVVGERFLPLMLIAGTIYSNKDILPVKFTFLLDKRNLPYTPFLILTIEIICTTASKLLYKLLMVRGYKDIRNCLNPMKTISLKNLEICANYDRGDGSHMLQLNNTKCLTVIKDDYCSRTKIELKELNTTKKKMYKLKPVISKIDECIGSQHVTNANSGKSSLKSFELPPEYDEDWQDVISLFNSAITSRKKDQDKYQISDPWERLRLELELQCLTLQLRRHKLEIFRLMLS